MTLKDELSLRVAEEGRLRLQLKYLNNEINNLKLKIFREEYNLKEKQVVEYPVGNFDVRQARIYKIEPIGDDFRIYLKGIKKNGQEYLREFPYTGELTDLKKIK